MFKQILGNMLAFTGKALVNGGKSFSKSIVEHFSRNGAKYAAGAGSAVIAAGGAYVVGEAKGHEKGKIEGVNEQSKRDKKKINELKSKHETDRKRWNQLEQRYNNLLDDVEKER